MNPISRMYHDSSLAGEFLIKPLKQYRIFFLSKQGALWKLAHCITALVAYPVLGLLAAFGMLIKFFHIYCIEKNREQAQQLKADFQAHLDRHFPGERYQVTVSVDLFGNTVIEAKPAFPS